MNTATMPVNSSSLKGFRASGGTVSHIDYSNLPVGSGVIRVTNNGTSTASIGMAQDSLSGFTTGTKYTESCWVRASTTVNMYLQPIWISSSQTTGNSTQSIDKGGLGGYFSIGTNWTYIKWEGATLAGEQATTYSSAYIYAPTMPANGWFEVCGMKVEAGEKATPWCPNSSDALATTMGLNGTTEYDCSGYCNNGTRTGTFSWTSDTPKYEVSTIFNSSNCVLSDSPTTEGATLAAWVKVPSIVNGAYFIDYKSGLGFGTWSNYLMPSCNASIKTTYKNTNFTINKWNHIVVVKRNSTTVELYINGILQPQHSTTDSWTTGVIDKLSLAARPNGTNLMSCQLSDFRIYATALSASDVNSLYQNSAYIDSDGNVYGAVHSEV